MRHVFLIGLLCCSGAASAQHIAQLGPGVAVLTGPNLTTSQSAELWDAASTPTMQRQRAEQENLVFTRFPALRAEMAAAEPWQARRLFDRALRQIRWERSGS